MLTYTCCVSVFLPQKRRWYDMGFVFRPHKKKGHVVPNNSEDELTRFIAREQSQTVRFPFFFLLSTFQVRKPSRKIYTLVYIYVHIFKSLFSNDITPWSTNILVCCFPTFYPTDMTEQAIHLLPTFPHTWGATLNSDGRFTVSCPRHIVDDNAVSQINYASTHVIYNQLVKNIGPASFSSAIKHNSSFGIHHHAQPSCVKPTDCRSHPEQDETLELTVSANASRHVFVHDVVLTMKQNSFLLVTGLFHNVSFQRDDLNDNYFVVKQTGRDRVNRQYFVCDMLSVPIYHLMPFDSRKNEVLTILDTTTNAEVCKMEQPGGPMRTNHVRIWRQSRKTPWVLLVANRHRNKFDFVEIHTGRTLLVVTRKTKPFAKLLNIEDEFSIHIAPFVDTALATLWVVLMARSFCL